jgi:hypothetical protein
MRIRIKALFHNGIRNNVEKTLSPGRRFFLALKGAVRQDLRAPSNERTIPENMAMDEEQVCAYHFGICHMDALL